MAEPLSEQADPAEPKPPQAAPQAVDSPPTPPPSQLDRLDGPTPASAAAETLKIEPESLPLPPPQSPLPSRSPSPPPHESSDQRYKYPPLQSSPGYDRPGAAPPGPWTAAGIRIAPLRVPLVRRLQTGAVLFHCMTIGIQVSLFFFLCAVPLLWPVIVPYLVHLCLSTAAVDGRLRFRSELARSLPLWRLFADYFPMRLHKTHDLRPDRRYILAYHPHGIISHGAWAAFATNALGFAALFPAITNTLCTLESNFRLPLYRDWILAMGLASVSKESIGNLLTRGGSDGRGAGRAVTIVVGGARESLEAQPGTLRLIMHGRKGFVKIAIRLGADLVPVLGFGENDLYDQLSRTDHPTVHWFQMVVLRWLRFTLPAVHGRGVLNYDVGLMPYRRPANIVVGRPIAVTQAENPAQDEIDRLHGLYVAELRNMWDTYKDQFAPNRTAEMEFIG